MDEAIAFDKLKPHMQLFARLVDKISGKRSEPLPVAAELPTDIYLDKALLKRERAEVFDKTPIIVGHASMLDKPGSHFTHDLLGKPLLIVKGKDGEIRAFLNVCRHRGMRLVVEEGINKTPVFVCPYHHWTYQLDGKLRNAPLKDGFDGADLSCRNLKTVQCEVRHGFIWVQIDDETPMDLDSFLGTIGDDLESFGVPEQFTHKYESSEKKANWKLIVEAFQDGYHVVRLHNKTVGPFFVDAQSSVERVGMHLRAAVARKEFMDAIDLPPAEWDDRNHASFAHFIFPNTIMVYHPDYISQLGLFPQDTDKTIVTHTFLTPKKPETYQERDHLDRSYDLIENGVFQSEDYFVCENAQRGMASGANETLLLSGYEEGIVLFHEIMDDALKRAD